MKILFQKIKTKYLVFSCVILVAGISLCFLLKTQSRADDYDVLFASAKRMEKAMDAIKEYCVAHGIELEEADINGTYLIGPEFSELMSTMGYEDIKRTTVNPDNAAVLARYFLDAGLHCGDTVGIGSSGSFPAYTVAALCAATELGLNTKVIASYGASMFGATRPDLNIVTILQILKDCGIAEFNLVAVSPGSQGDHGTGAFDGFLYENTRELVLSLASQSGAPLIDPADLEESISCRLDYFGKLDCFVNIGGAGANSGGSSASLDFPEGLVTSFESIPSGRARGLIFEYAMRGIPVINILNVRKIAADNGLEQDPYPVPKAGTSGIYYETIYPLWLVCITLVMSLGVLCYGCVRFRRTEFK